MLGVVKFRQRVVTQNEMRVGPIHRNNEISDVMYTSQSVSLTAKNSNQTVLWSWTPYDANTVVLDMYKHDLSIFWRPRTLRPLLCENHLKILGLNRT